VAQPAVRHTRPRARAVGDERGDGAWLANGHPLQNRRERARTRSKLVTKQKLPQSAQIAITVAAFLLIAIAGYFVAVKPQKSKASSLSAEIAAKNNQISDARALLAKAKDAQKVRVADLFRLTKAMPDQPDEAGIVLELNAVARESGITFDSITPQGSTALSGYQVVPIN